MIEIAPGAGSGRIGPFWWVNGNHESHEVVGLVGLADNPSRHLAWRSGGCGWMTSREPFITPLRWHIIQNLN